MIQWNHQTDVVDIVHVRWMMPRCYYSVYRNEAEVTGISGAAISLW